MVDEDPVRISCGEVVPKELREAVQMPQGDGVTLYYRIEDMLMISI